MSIKGLPHPNKRTATTAAAFCGVVGLPDPSHISGRGDGSLLTWCRRDFLPAFDRLTERRPELRSFARAEREARVR